MFLCAYYISVSGFTKICNKKITFQCIIFIVPEEGWFGQPKYSTHIKTFLRCTGFCLYFLHFIYVKPFRSPLIQRTPAGSSFRLLAQTKIRDRVKCTRRARARKNPTRLFSTISSMFCRNIRAYSQSRSFK